MRKNLTLSALALLAFHPLYPQSGIDSTTNTMRHGDILCKVEIPFSDAGDRGEDCIWMLPAIPNDAPDHLQGINSNGDTIAVYDQGKILHYMVHGDTLCCKGWQSRRAYEIYSEERPSLRYPFQYGDSIASTYCGECRYEKAHYKVLGSGYTVADSEGILTDGEDTLRHVTRLHLHDDRTYDYGGGRTRRTTEDRYQWFCAGYRYAVMESVMTVVEKDSETVPSDSILYLFLPCMQLELAEDDVNEALLAELAAADASRNSGSAGSLSSVDASLSSDGQSVTVHYQLSLGSDISFTACDIMGNVLGQAQCQNREAGEWQECITLVRRPIGNALMLGIRCGEAWTTIKVYR